jgi:DHA1 family tetracycline resistance protein-like MFS transporter
MMSRRADATNQGEVQGFASSVMAVGSIIAPMVFNPALAWFTGPDAPFRFYGIAFVIAAVFALIGLAILVSLAPAGRADPALAD